MTDKIPQPVPPEGNYPFIDQLYPLAELEVIEVPLALRKQLVIKQEKNSTCFIRDAPTDSAVSESSMEKQL